MINQQLKFRQNTQRSHDLKYKNLEILEELKDISDQLQVALEQQKYQQSPKNKNQITKDSQGIVNKQQEYQAELEKAFNILDLQKRDIDMLSQKLEQNISFERKIDEQNIQLVEKNKEIKALENEKNYLNKVLGNIDRIMKIEGQKDQKLQQVHVAYKDEIRILKERIKELESIQKQSERNAMKLHQHYVELEEKYKQTLQNNNIFNKNPLKAKNPQKNPQAEQIKNDYQDQIQTFIQQLKDKEIENVSIKQSLEIKQSEVADLKEQIKEFQLLIQQQQKDKEVIEDLNKTLLEQINKSYKNYSQQQTQTEQSDNNSIKSRLVTPKKDQVGNNSQSPLKSFNSSVKRERTNITERSQEINDNKSFNRMQDGVNRRIKTYNKYDYSQNKKELNSSNLNNNRHSLDVQSSKERYIEKNTEKINSSFVQENSQKLSLPSTPPQNEFKRKYRSTSINSEMYRRKGSTEKREQPGQNYNNEFSNKKYESYKKQNINQTKIIRENDNLIPELQQLNDSYKQRESQEYPQLDKKRSIDKRHLNINEQNQLIETPYIRTLNTRYQALKNQSEVKYSLQTEQNSQISRKQKMNIKSQNEKVQPIRSKNSNLKQNDQKQINNNKTNNQYPSDVSEFDLNNTFVEFQKQVSQQDIKKLLQDYEEAENSQKKNSNLYHKDENQQMNNNSNCINSSSSQMPNLQWVKSNYENSNCKQLSIGNVSPHNQISFSDQDYLNTSNTQNNKITFQKIVGGRFWIFKQTHKIMGLQIQYLTNQNKVVWGSTNVHIFTQNVSVQYFSLVQNIQQNDDYQSVDYISMIGYRYNNLYSYIENIVFISQIGKVFSFGKSVNEQINPLIYFDIDIQKEIPFSICGAISKEYDPMSGNLIGTKLSNFGCQIQNLNQQNNCPIKEEYIQLSENKSKELKQFKIIIQNSEQQKIDNEETVPFNQNLNDQNKPKSYKLIAPQQNHLEKQSRLKQNNDQAKQNQQQKDITDPDSNKLDPELQRILNQYK